MANQSLGGIYWQVDADTSPAVNSAKQFDSTVDKTTTTLKKLDTQTTKTARAVNSGMSVMSRRAGQAGIQIQQLIGQIQGGQSAMLALSQQSADLGFVLGAPLLGAVGGIAASLVGMLLPALMDSSAQTEELTEKIRELAKASILTEAQSAFLVDQTNDEIEANKQLSDELESRIAGNKAIIDNYDAIAKKKEEGIKLTLSEKQVLEVMGEQVEKMRKSMIEDKAQRDTLSNDLDALTKKRAAYSLATKQSIKDQEDETKSTIKLQTALERLGENLTAQVATLGMSNREVAHYKASLLGASDVMHDQIDAIYDHKEALKLEQEQLKASTEEEKRRLAKMKEVAEWQAQRRTEAMDFATSISDRGLSEADQRRIELEALEAVYEEGLISEQAYQDALTQIRAEGEAERQASFQMTLTSMESAFGNLAQVFADAEGESSAGYKAMFAISKAFAVASAGMNTALAISNAMKDVPYPGNIALMAQAAASGAALLSTISGATFSGRENGGSVLANTPYEVGEKNKPELLMIPGNNGKVLSNSEMKSMMGGGGQLNQSINNYAAADGYEVRTRGDGVTAQQVVDIIRSESANPNSYMRRNLTKGTNIKNQVGGNRR